MRERKHILEGKRWVPVEDFDPGPLVYKNDEALGPSREARKGPVRMYIALEVFVVAFTIVVFAPLFEGAQRNILVALFVILAVLYISIQWTEIRNVDRTDFLPRVHEKAVVCSYVSYYAHELVMMPYDQLADIQRHGKYVLLVTRPWRKFSLRYWELGDVGFRVLMDIFVKARVGDYPVAG